MHIQKCGVDIEIRTYPNKGRGLCSKQYIQPGTIIETVPVLVINPEAYERVKKLPFINHTFVWKKGPGQEEWGALAFGLATMCNHSAIPNAKVDKNYENDTLDLVAIRTILPGEEITFKYQNTRFEVH